MSISNVLSGTSNSSFKVATTSNNKSATETSASSVQGGTSSTTKGFGEMVAQANLGSLPSKTLSPEILASTVQSTTLQTSGYHFDPLSVVGIVPESNTFLQAIRAMLGKPFEPAAKDPAAVAQNAAPTLPITPTSPALTAQTQAAAAKSIGSPDLLNSIEAQLTYQASSNASRSLTTASDVATETLSKAIEASKSQAFSMTNTATNLPLYSATDLVDQYIARSSAAAVASIESALVKDVVQHSPDV
jgi:hypothetical protein